MAIALDKGITVSGEPRSDRQIVLRSESLPGTCAMSLDALAPCPSHPWANYVLGVVHEFRSRGADGPGFDLTIAATLPAGSGLSSSAALECATARFVQELWATRFDPMQLALIGQAAEHGYVGVKCGLLDQISSLFGAPDKIVCIDCRTLTVDLVPAPAGLAFAIAQSGVQHALVAGEYNERRASCEAAARALGIRALRDIDPAGLEAASDKLDPLQLKRARHIVGENARVERARAALAADDPETFGQLMFESHDSSRVNFENSCPELDHLVAAARESPDCLGARLSGGGFGGATINLVRRSGLDRFSTHLRARFESAVGRSPAILISEASGVPI